MLVYPVAIGGTRPPLFGELANVTGGRSFFIDDPEAPRVAAWRSWRASCASSICSAMRRSEPSGSDARLAIDSGNGFET